MERDLARQGQVFFVHNRVQTLPQTTALVKELVPGATCRIEMVGPTICAHAGPGTLAVVFLGAERERE